jgi:hypothetical protein
MISGSAPRASDAKDTGALELNISCHSTPAKRFRFERCIKTLSQRIMATHGLPTAIEHTLLKWPPWISGSNHHDT